MHYIGLNNTGELVWLLNSLSIYGVRRHLLIEMFILALRDSYGGCSSYAAAENHFLAALDIPLAGLRELLEGMAREDLIECSKDMKSGCVSGISFGDKLYEAGSEMRRRIDERDARIAAAAPIDPTPKPPKPKVRLRAHLLFDNTCELCGDKAVLGKDQWGKDMRVSRKKKKDLDGTAENVTLLCSKCERDHRGRDLPDECRTLRMLEIAQERGYEQAPRTAVPALLPPKVKEVVILASGPISVKTRNVEQRAGGPNSEALSE